VGRARGPVHQLVESRLDLVGVHVECIGEACGEAGLVLLVDLVERRRDPVGGDPKRLGQGRGKVVAPVARLALVEVAERLRQLVRVNSELVRQPLESRWLPSLEERRRTAVPVLLGPRLVGAGNGGAVVRLRAEAVAHGRHSEGAADDDDRALSSRLHAARLTARCRTNVRAA
jgi:hypothetical protein